VLQGKEAIQKNTQTNMCFPTERELPLTNATLWSAVAERSGDGALDRSLIESRNLHHKFKRGVALRLPPHNK
jgi:hypothetical protein